MNQNEENEGENFPGDKKYTSPLESPVKFSKSATNSELALTSSTKKKDKDKRENKIAPYNNIERSQNSSLMFPVARVGNSSATSSKKTAESRGLPETSSPQTASATSPYRPSPSPSRIVRQKSPVKKHARSGEYGDNTSPYSESQKSQKQSLLGSPPDPLQYLQSEFIDFGQTMEDLKINAVSPISTETKDLSIGLDPSQNPSTNHDNNQKESSLDPLKTNSGKQFLDSVFRESSTSNFGSNNATISGKESDQFSFNSDSLSSNIKNRNSKKEKTWWKRNKHTVFYSFLVSIILILIGGFIPITILLFNGTKETVDNYFRLLSDDERLKMLNFLINDYGMNNSTKTNSSVVNYHDRVTNMEIIKGSRLAGVNTLAGINPKYKNDPEVVALMSDREIFGTVFYGLGYAPRNAMEPICGVTKRDILLDLSLISRVTTRIRNYGMQCNQSDLILDSIQDLQLNMTLAMGVWIGSNETINNQQMNLMKDMLRKYPRHLFESIFVGNEVLFREEQTSQGLSEYIKDAKDFAVEIGYSDLPIGTSEIGSLVDKTLLKNCDIVGANIHPFFAGGDVKVASKWVFDFVKYQIEPLNEDINTEIIISEIGWPYNGGQYEGSVANPRSFQTFLNDWVCDAYESHYGWYYFEAFDEPWKKIFYEDGNTWETEWGVFSKDRNHKNNILLPNC